MYSRKKLRSGSTTCSPENNVNMAIKRRDDYYLPSLATCGEKKTSISRSSLFLIIAQTHHSCCSCELPKKTFLWATDCTLVWRSVATRREVTCLRFLERSSRHKQLFSGNERSFPGRHGKHGLTGAASSEIFAFCRYAKTWRNASWLLKLTYTHSMNALHSRGIYSTTSELRNKKKRVLRM